MNKKKEKPTGSTIVIRLNGDETTATIMGDEFKTRITRAVAYRNPKDEYDAYIGARVALDRLFGKDDMFADKKQEEPKKDTEPEKTDAPKSKPKFQVGDIVRVTYPIFTLGLYEKNDVAVVTEIRKTPGGSFSYEVRIRSKERKGRTVFVGEFELTLLHRAKGAEQA